LKRRFPLSGRDRALDWRGAPVLGQKRGVNVDEAQAGDGQERLRQKLAVGGDNTEIGAERGERSEELLVLEALGLENWDLAAKRDELYGAVPRPVLPAARPVRLRHHAHDRMGAADEALERGDRERGRTEEHDLHRGAPAATMYRCVSACGSS
jgi:hypothetical protein